MLRLIARSLIAIVIIGLVNMKTEQVFSRQRPLPPMLSPTRLSAVSFASTNFSGSKDEDLKLKMTFDSEEGPPKLQRQVKLLVVRK